MVIYGPEFWAGGDCSHAHIRTTLYYVGTLMMRLTCLSPVYP